MSSPNSDLTNRVESLLSCYVRLFETLFHRRLATQRYDFPLTRCAIIWNLFLCQNENHRMTFSRPRGWTLESKEEYYHLCQRHSFNWETSDSAKCLTKIYLFIFFLFILQLMTQLYRKKRQKYEKYSFLNENAHVFLDYNQSKEVMMIRALFVWVFSVENFFWVS